MRIGIDARMYGPTVGGGGLGRYVEQLVMGLQKYNTEHRFVLFLKKENFDACRITNPLFEKRLADIHWYGLKEQYRFPALIEKEQLDLIHYPHWNIPLLCRTPFVVTIHDVILLEEPKSARITTRSPFHFWIKYVGYKLALARALQKSKNIVAVSHYTKKRLQKFFPALPEKKITVVYEGITTFANASTESLPTNITDPYLLYIGNAYPHKNLEVLLAAFTLFSKDHPDIQLVLAGRDDIFYKRLKDYAEGLSLAKHRIVFIPTPSDALVQTLFKHALLYVFPSRVEGFGLPPLEAMSHGVPVISSHASCLPEILQDAAVYFDPNNIPEIAATLSNIFCDSNAQAFLRQEGFKQVSHYSWDEMAKTLLTLYGGITTK